MSFLQRLKGRGVRSGDLIVIYAQAAGADLSDIHVSIEGDADIVLIEGRRLRPEFLAFPKKKPDGAYFSEECVWGDFYRRIILPESIDIENAEAKIKNGVLVLVLPLMKPEEKEKVKLKITKAKRRKRMS